MVKYRIEFTKSAKKEFDRLPKPIQEKALEALTLLQTNPFSELLGVKKLKGAESLYRVRFGDYRMVYEVRKKILLVVIIKFGHRREIYR